MKNHTPRKLEKEWNRPIFKLLLKHSNETIVCQNIMIYSYLILFILSPKYIVTSTQFFAWYRIIKV